MGLLTKINEMLDEKIDKLKAENSILLSLKVKEMHVRAMIAHYYTLRGNEDVRPHLIGVAAKAEGLLDEMEKDLETLKRIRGCLPKGS